MPDSLIKGTDVSVYQSYPTVGLSGTFYVKPAILAITGSFEEPERHLLGSAAARIRDGSDIEGPELAGRV